MSKSGSKSGSQSGMRARMPGRMVRWALVLALAGVAGVRPALADRVAGAWGANGAWPLIPIHLLLLPDGRVLSYGSNPDGTQTGRFWYDVWNPSQGNPATGHLTLRNTTTTDLFCSAQIVPPGGSDAVLLGGDNWIAAKGETSNQGNRNSLLFKNTATPSLTRAADMNRRRWYATATTLPSGEIYIQGGKNGTDRAEIRSKSGTFRLLAMDTSALTYWYPRNFVAPDGRVFGISNFSLYWVDPAGNGKLTMAGSLGADDPSGVTTTDVLFDTGKILRVGGGSQTSTGTRNGKTTAVVIDINGATPKVTATKPLPYGLHWHTGTLVPDGRVVVTGGSRQPNQLVGVNNKALIWDPKTGNWTQAASTPATNAYARLYHSNALLLPDATILVGGGGAPGPVANTNAQIYYPPYLYNAAGGFATRPRITSAPAKLTYGASFTLGTDQAATIAKVVAIKTGSVTHSFNMEQRRLELAFTRNGAKLTVQAPASNRLATPGHYLLFLLNASNVPSLAKIVQL